MTDTNDPTDPENNRYQRPDDGDGSGHDIRDHDEPAGDAAYEEVSDADMDDDQHDRVATEAAAPVQKMPSRLPGYLGLLLGLGGLGLAGYLYYLTQLQDPMAPFEKRMDEIATRAEANKGEVSQQSEALRQEIQAIAASQSQAADELRSEVAEQQENLEAAQSALAESMGETINAQPPTDRDWKLAEVGYLLRIANHRLLMEGDARVAGDLLESADKILAEMGDFSLFDVRTRLADEILSVKSLTGTDLQGLYLQLEALKNNIKSLPPRVPEYLQSVAGSSTDTPSGSASDSAASQSAEGAQQQPDAQASDGGAGQDNAWKDMGSRLSAFFNYRKIDGSEVERPLISPDQALYLEMNLRLMLERAQLALMRRNQLVYEESLSTAEEWIAEYLETDNQAVNQVQEQIAELIAVELERPIPDISGSLTALEAITRGGDE